jgi:uncharacterized coiled-coil DUF342 family protein
MIIITKQMQRLNKIRRKEEEIRDMQEEITNKEEEIRDMKEEITNKEEEIRDMKKRKKSLKW